MHQLLNCGRRVIRRNGRLTFLVALSLILSCCSDTPTQPARAQRNTFPDYQHISGYVSGVWTKEHNPYVITGNAFVKDGDSLVIAPGTIIIMSATITIEKSVFDVRGTLAEPVRIVHNGESNGGGVSSSAGAIRFAYGVFEGNGKGFSAGMNTQISHSVFSESILFLDDFYVSSSDSTVVENCIFAGFRPRLATVERAAFMTYGSAPYYSVLDSSKASIHNNVFYPGIGDSNWVSSPYNIVDVRLKGSVGIQHIQGYQWPGNGNLFGDPKWVKYNFVGPSPAGISDNDYHLQPGSPAIGAASDGGNIGAY